MHALICMNVGSLVQAFRYEIKYCKSKMKPNSWQNYRENVRFLPHKKSWNVPQCPMECSKHHDRPATFQVWSLLRAQRVQHTSRCRYLRHPSMPHLVNFRLSLLPRSPPQGLGFHAIHQMREVVPPQRLELPLHFPLDRQQALPTLLVLGRYPQPLFRPMNKIDQTGPIKLVSLVFMHFWKVFKTLLLKITIYRSFALRRSY